MLLFVGLACFYLLLGQCYWRPVRSLAKPDEALHLVYVADVQRGTLWPIALLPGDAALDVFSLDQRCQPPLYYWLTAIATAATPAPWPPTWMSENPFFLSGIPYANGARAVSIREASDALAPARQFSLLLGVLTLAAAFGAARMLMGRGAAALTALVTATLPAVIFAQSGVSDLALAAPLHAMAVWVSLKVWQRGGSRRRWLLAAVVLALAVWTRIESTLLVVLFAACALRDLRLRRLDGRGLFVAALVGLVLCAPLLARNLIVYGNLTASNCLTVRPAPLRLDQWLTLEGSGFFRAIFATLGEGFIFDPEPVYAMIAFALGMAALGWVRRLRAGVNGLWLLVGLHAALIFIAAIAGSLSYVAGGPRYIGSYGLSWMAMWVFGVLAWFPGRWRRLGVGIGVVALLALHYVTLTRVLWPEYVPALTSLSAIPSDAAEAHLGEGIELRGAVVQPAAADGRHWTVTAWWEATREPSDNYAVFVHVEDETGHIVAQYDSYAVHGNEPTSWWPVGRVFVDHYSVVLPDTLDEPLSVTLGLFQPNTGVRLEAWELDGDRLPQDAVPVGVIR